MKKRSRVRVLPERLLPTSVCRPPEPLEPPPPPEELVSLLVVGDSKCGKSSLVKSFISHESLPNGTEQEGDSQHDNAKGFSVTYTKKDVLFADRDNRLRSMRVQLWDTSGIDPGKSGGCVMQAPLWNSVWNKASKILLVVPLPAEPPKWEETLQRIRTWKVWLDHQNPCHQEQEKPIVVLMHQGDRLASSSDNNNNTLSALEWMTKGKQMSELCQHLQIHSWYITSSCLQNEELGNSIDMAFSKILGEQSYPPRSIPYTISTNTTVATATVPNLTPESNKTKR